MGGVGELENIGPNASLPANVSVCDLASCAGTVD